VSGPTPSPGNMQLPRAASDLSDVRTQRILALLIDRPMTARMIGERLNIETANVYRNLRNLELLNMVHAELCPDNHHKRGFSTPKEYHADVDTLVITVAKGSLSYLAHYRNGTTKEFWRYQ